MTISKKQIREYLGHNGYDCKVKIKRDGQIMCYGSTDPFDRSRDFWHGCGTVDEIINQMIDEQTYCKPV